MRKGQLDGIIFSTVFILCTLVSSVLSLVILSATGKLVAKFFEDNLFVSAFLPLMIAVILTIVVITIQRGYRMRRSGFMNCLLRCLGVVIVFAGIWAVILLITKTGVTDSRYFFTLTIFIDWVLYSVVFFLVQRYVVEHYHETKSATLAGIITVSSRVDYITEALKKDWTRKVAAIMLLDRDLKLSGEKPKTGKTSGFRENDGIVRNLGGKVQSPKNNATEPESGKGDAEKFKAGKSGVEEFRAVKSSAVNPIKKGGIDRNSLQANKSKNLEKYVEEIERIHHVPVVADKNTFVEWIQKNALDEVFIDVDEENMPLVNTAIEDLSAMGVQINMNLPGVEDFDRKMNKMSINGYHPRMVRSLHYVYGMPMVSAGPPYHRLLYMAVKRALDILGGLVGTAIFGILFLIFAIPIKLDSPGPVIFSQIRIGKNGRKFRMYKFRSMRQGAEKEQQKLAEKNEMQGQMFKMENDPRITKIGHFLRKTSIDEFPQFVNVLKGDMSLVGTRPQTEDEFLHYTSYHKRRLMMKPGITGLWQVSGRSDIQDFEEVVRLDLQYIDNWSIRGDLKILLKTVQAVFSRKGAE